MRFHLNSERTLSMILHEANLLRQKTYLNSFASFFLWTWPSEPTKALDFKISRNQKYKPETGMKFGLETG